MFENFTYNLRNLLVIRSTFVRKSVLICSGVILVLSIPGFFLGQLSSELFKRTWFDQKSILNSELQNVGKINVSQTQVIDLEGTNKDFYVSISNKENKNIGFSPFNYTLRLLNSSNQVIFQENKSEFLLPDETKFVTIRSDNPDAKKIEIIEGNNTPKIYNPNSNSLARDPKIEIRQSRITEQDNGQLKIFTQFKNSDSVTIKNAEILYIIRDTRQSVVGIGSFQLNGFVANEIRDLTIDYPKPLNREAKSLDIRIRVNYLDENNFSR